MLPQPSFFEHYIGLARPLLPGSFLGWAAFMGLALGLVYAAMRRRNAMLWARAAGRPVVLITGAANGIGRSAAKLFNKNGWFVAMVDSDANGLREMFNMLGGSENCWTMTADVSNEGQMRTVAREFGSQVGGRLDCLVNNAAVLKWGLFADSFALPHEVAKRIVEVGAGLPYSRAACMR